VSVSDAPSNKRNKISGERKIAGGNAMKSKMLPVLALALLLASAFVEISCGNGPGNVNCPTCGTNQNGSVTLIDSMIVPEHNPNGEPGGPFNIFDISWLDPVNQLYSVTDRTGLDVPVFSSVTNIALFAIGGDNSVAEAGDNASVCDPSIPPITTAQGNFTRFGCKNAPFRLPGFFGPNGHFGGWMGGQCCASRSNNLNPLTGPNGIEVSADGNFMFVGSGSSSMAIFDLRPTLASNSTPPPVIANISTGTSPDYDGLAPPSGGISGCQSSANGRAFSDPTCGDLRGDELATTGGFVSAPDGSKHFLVGIINGDPGQPFFTVIDVSGVINGALTPIADPSIQQLQLEHCLPNDPLNPYSPGGGDNTLIGDGSTSNPNNNFPKNYSSCILGQIYYDNTIPTDNTQVVDEAVNPCPFPSLEFPFPPGGTRHAVPTGASGDAVGPNPTVPCHHGPMLSNSTGQFCATAASFPDCTGAVALAGLGGMVFNPNTGHFLLTNGNSTFNVIVGSVDEIDPFGPTGPAVINSFPIPSCMPTGISLGPGTDALVGCADHDGRAFAPSSVIINSTTGAILTTINNVGFVDETWFNPGDNRYYLAARDMPTGPVLGVIDAKTRQWLQNVPTNGNAHSVAADPNNNHIFVPLAAGGAGCLSVQADGCVGVYARD
jgi:hypothetical protein